MRQIGTDYGDPAEIDAFDERMAAFRDVETENRRILDTLELPLGSSILEIGCATGRFARFAVATGYAVCAIDVSARMLDFVQRKSEAQGLKGIGLQHAGFLTMDFEEEVFDAVVSNTALHHLPDAWKLVALRNIARVLKPKGQLWLGDVVFSLAEGEAPEKCFERFCDVLPSLRTEVARHVAIEFSTYDWIMEGLLVRSGFEIVSKENPAESFLVYRCRKRGDRPRTV